MAVQGLGLLFGKNATQAILTGVRGPCGTRGSGFRAKPLLGRFRPEVARRAARRRSSN
jgi:hypothetical protein